MSEYKKNTLACFRTTSAIRDCRLMPFAKRGLLAVALAGAIGGCAQIPHGSMFSADHLQQSQAAHQSQVAHQSLSITKDIDLVRLQGVVGSDAEATMIRYRAASIYGPEMLIDELEVDESLAQTHWYSAVLDTAESMQGVEKFAIHAANGELQLNGFVQSRQVAESLENVAASAIGQQLVVSNTLDYPGRESAVLAQRTNGTDNSAEQTIATLDSGDSTAASTMADTAQSQQVSTRQRVELAEQKIAAQSMPGPAISSTISLPVTTSAVVLEQRASAAGKNNRAELMLPPSDDGIVQSSNRGSSNDIDGDGVANSIDECDTRPGYPVNAKGCQALDGFLKNVRFHGKSDKLTSQAMSSLDNVAQVLQEHPASRIAILSYTSNTGSPWETRGQARERARSVVGYLINKGVASNRLEAYAFGHINGSEDRIMIKEVD